jgi:hypothetical protein
MGVVHIWFSWNLGTRFPPLLPPECPWSYFYVLLETRTTVRAKALGHFCAPGVLPRGAGPSPSRLVDLGQMIPSLPPPMSLEVFICRPLPGGTNVRDKVSHRLW